MASTCSREFAKRRKRAETETKKAKDQLWKKAGNFRSKYVSISKLVSAFEEEMKDKELKESWYFTVPVKCSSWNTKYARCTGYIRYLIANKFQKRLADCFFVESCHIKVKSDVVHISICVELIKNELPEVSSSSCEEEESSSSTT